MSSKVEYLVVDTSAFIKNAQVQEIADVIITIDDVLNEIKSSRQLKRLVVLPYDLQIKSVEAESISIVTKFAKKTGDYPALSATDIKVLALTYQLEKEHVGTEHLRSEPVAPKSVEPIEPNEIKPGDIVGFYSPDGDSEDDDDKENETNSNDSDEEKKLEDVDESEESESEGDADSAQEELEGEQEVPEVDSDLILRLKDMSCNETITDCDQNDPCALDDDEAGWITPGNLKESKRGIYGGTLEEKSVKVACLTTDFAMQNVLKQMGLNMVSLDGLVIKEVRTFILRCYSCFKTTPIMTKLFCSHCGNKTLKRVSVTVDEEGKEHIHINFRRPLTGKGKKFPLPKFQGGKHSSNPILSEDQRVPQQRLTRIARQKNNPMDDDYIAGVSPFLMRDVSSKSAILGVQRKVEVKSWMRRNPNEVAKKRRKR